MLFFDRGDSILTLMMICSPAAKDYLKAIAASDLIKKEGMLIECPDPSSVIMKTSESSFIVSPISAI